MSTISSSLLYQIPSSAALKAQYVGQKLKDIQAPAAIIDLAVVKKNCNLMLEAAESLKVQFRAHVKTHKTSELAQLQAGESGPVRLIVSTIPELEHMIPWLLEVIKQGRVVDVLYGVPCSPSSLPRLAKLAHVLGSSKHISLMVDHVETLSFISRSSPLWPGGPIRIFVKIDTGYHRSGVTFDSSQLNAISTALSKPETKEQISLLGLYSHLGHSYAFNTPTEAIQGLLTELTSLAKATTTIQQTHGPLVLSVGATPTATAAQTLSSPSPLTDPAQKETADSLHTHLSHLKSKGLIPELHAGVYPVLDMQQLATHSRTTNLTPSDIGLTILAEVSSLYPDRATPEALISAGSLVLGREPCKSYPGWGVVTPWPNPTDPNPTDSNTNTTNANTTTNPIPTSPPPYYSEDSKTGWIVGRVSQEHGILTWQSPTGSPVSRELVIGQKVMIWPNHACVAGSGFGWYFVVDSESGDGDVVRDVWVRCRGW
ncbi:hypothetical protein EG327_009935 [Venturia inaequalis]|uniref:D-serine dehydratase n=1 Tax=Venturia inaequalis TaxID=5025 RepID=A0A8H3UJ83_VENIN|nr:hypothetical protein EG327_009935 [Venturia inaequalis]